MTTPDRTLLLWRHTRPRVEQAITNAVTFLDGYPAGSGGRSTDPEQSRTMTLALNHVDKGDTHGALHADLERTIRHLADLVDRLAPNTKAQSHLASQATDTGCPEGWCESCWRDNHHHSPTRSPGGRMCRWCEDAARHLGVDLPPLTLVAKHNRGQRITDRDLRR